MIRFLSERSPRILGLALSSDVWHLRTLFEVVSETFTGFPKVGSVMSEGFKSKLHRVNEKICPQVFSPFDSINSTPLEICFFPADAFMAGVRTTYRC